MDSKFRKSHGKNMRSDFIKSKSYHNQANYYEHYHGSHNLKEMPKDQIGRYPKYWFLTMLVSIITILVLMNFWLYSELYDVYGAKFEPGTQEAIFWNVFLIQGVIKKLLLISLITILIVLFLTYLAYRKLYQLEYQNIKIINDKKYFKQRAEITLASTNDGVIITNSTAQVVYANHVIEKMLNKNFSKMYHVAIDELIAELEIINKSDQDNLKVNDIKISFEGKEYYFDLQSTKLFNDSDKFIGTAIFLHDLTSKKRAEEKINYLAYYDGLTALPNKLSMVEHYNQVIIDNNIYSSGNYKLFTVVINIPSLKNINDTIGYQYGDEAIVKLVSVFKQDKIYRIGGNSFAMLVEYDKIKHGKSSMLFITNFINNLIFDINKPIHIYEEDLYLQCYVGVSVYPDNFIINNVPDNSLEPTKLLRFAEIAMSDARRKGLNKSVFYSEDINTSILNKFNLENELRKALTNNKLELFFQPQTCLRTDKLRGFEILIRWHRADGTIVLPDTFIPILEKSGLIVTVGDWIIKEACLAGVQLLKNNIEFSALAVNISGLQLQSEGFIDRLNQILLETKFPREYLELEITENILLDNQEMVIKMLLGLRAQNIKVALDDFGTGFSSLNYLNRLPLDYIKIDKTFVDPVGTDGDTRLLLAILAIAKSMNLKTIAEGVETKEQANFLRAHNCDIIQGYYVHKPMSLSAVIEMF